MGERESLCRLGSSVEMDEAFFGGKAAGKRGRGSENKTEIAVALRLGSDGRLKCLHVMISNIKANIEGACHGLEGTYPQRYLSL